MAGSISSSSRSNQDARPLASEVHRIRKDFPILEQRVNGAALVYLDNAATSHKPLAVIDALNRFYLASNSNINRGVHALGERATELYDEARARAKIHQCPAER